MAAPNTRNVVKIPGTLVKNPTNLSAAYPYGGTILGEIRAFSFAVQSKHEEITAEEWGDQVVDIVHGGTSVKLSCVLRGFDNDALEAIFPDTEVAVPSRERRISWRVDNGRAGTLLSTLSFVLLFVPKAADRHNAVLMRDAVPVVEDALELLLSQDKEAELPVLFYGRPDANNKVAEVSRIGDMTL